MSGMAGENIQKIGKYPLIELTVGTCGQVDEADAALSRGTGPSDLPVGFDAQARKPQLKAQPDTLVLAQRANRLHGHTLAVEVADDSTVGLVEGNVGERAQLMPIVGAGLPRGKRYNLQTDRQRTEKESLGRGPFGPILVSGGGGLAVTGLVRGTRPLSLLLFLQLLQPVDAVLVLGIQLDRFLVVLNRKILLSRIRQGFPQAVIHIPGFWVVLDVALEYLDSVFFMARLQQVIAELIQGTFIQFIFGRTRFL